MADAWSTLWSHDGAVRKQKSSSPVVLFAVNSQQIGRRDDVAFQGTHPNMPSSLQFNAKLTGHHEAETPPPTVYLLLCVRQLLSPTKWRLQ